MNIRTLAEKDLSFTLEDSTNGFGWDVTLKNPAGLTSVDLKAQSGDVSQMLDLETGELVSGRLAICVMRISSLKTQGFTTLPQSVANGVSKPWVITFNDINGSPYTFKIAKSMPDRVLGVVKCVLEAYRVTQP